MTELLKNTTPWSQLKIPADGLAIRSLDEERIAAASDLATLDRWNIEALLNRTVTPEQPATFEEMMPLWVGNAAVSPIPTSRRDQYADFLSSVVGGDRFTQLVDALSADRGHLLECDLGPVHDYVLLDHFLSAKGRQGGGAGARKRVLEIGGGYGRLAEVVLRERPFPMTYILCDGVPESIYYGYAYLKARLPDIKIFPAFGGCALPPLQELDVLVLPSWRLPDLPDGSIDLAINVASIQEMPDATVRAYFAQLDRLLAKGSTFFFENSREFFYRREYPYPPNWRYLFKKKSPRSRTIDYPVDILVVDEGDQSERNLAMLGEYYQQTTASALDEVTRLKEALKADREKFREARDRLVAQSERLRRVLDERNDTIKKLKERAPKKLRRIRFLPG